MYVVAHVNYSQSQFKIVHKSLIATLLGFCPSYMPYSKANGL
jgi:hypothetical protein